MPEAGPDGGELLDARLRDLLEQVADESPSAASSAATAAAVALSAGLAAMAARRSRGQWPEAGGAIGQAEALGARAAELVQESADAYEAAVQRLEAGGAEDRPEQRDWSLGVVLARAADAPLELAETAADIGELCAEVAANCDPAVRADAVAGSLLAESGVRVAAHLVEVNLTTRADDERLARAEALRGRAELSRQRALTANP